MGWRGGGGCTDYSVRFHIESHEEEYCFTYSKVIVTSIVFHIQHTQYMMCQQYEVVEFIQLIFKI